MFEFHLLREYKKRKIKTKFKEDIEPQETFLDSLAKKKEEEFGLSEKKFETPLSRNILRIFFVFVFLLVFLLFAKTVQLQITEGETLFTQAENNKFTFYKTQAERGVVYDRNGKQLVWNKPSFDLILNIKSLPQQQTEKNKILAEVASILNINIAELNKKIAESASPEILISENIPHQALIMLETRINELAGFQIRNNTARDYRLGANFAHLLGYTGKISSGELKAEPDTYSSFDWVGRSGLERYYEEVLRKNPGKIKVERDAGGNILSQETVSLPESGNSLVLWLDSDLQNKIKEELSKTVERLGAENTVGVAMDPKTGGILAMVSIPDFDNNLFQKGSDPEALKNLLEDPKKSLFNRVISGLYPTGSTIKPLIAASVLQEGIILPQKKIDCHGEIVIPNPWDPTLPTIKKDWTTHGPTDLRQAIAQSCNVYFYTVGGGFGDQTGLGLARIKEYLQLFGWGEKTGIDLPGETTGFIPDKDWKKKTFNQAWVDGDTYNLAIGQGFLKVTPLEVVTAFSAIANDGKLLQPQIVQKIIDSEKNIIKEFRPKIVRENFIDQKNLQIVREGMRWAVTGQNSPQASSITLNSLPVSSAAKTGTAELGNDYYHNWVTVFAPYDDPQIVLTILIGNVKGAQVAALPVAKSILEWYFSR